ncbi:MAG TPA: nuclear transport factor 2 family protein [Thermoleophilaceae bacterium]|nr:nuclear transport factor 2 family protein [Thermoleophilaceae bacterium]
MPEPNVELVRELLDRFNRDDRAGIFELLSEDFVAEVPPSLSAEPDVYRGHAGAQRYLDAFDGFIEDVRFEPLEFLPEGEHVIVDMLLKGRGASSGIAVELRSAVVHTVEDGKVKRMDPHPDVEAARASLGRIG